MERREGNQYDLMTLIGDLLEQKSFRWLCNSSSLFLVPGRHAGLMGHCQICAPFIKRDEIKTPTLGNHRLILEILAERLKEVIIE